MVWYREAEFGLLRYGLARQYMARTEVRYGAVGLG